MAQDKLKVLLIEHDSGFARYLSEMLGQARDFAADMLSAQSLGKGLSALADDNFDVVVIDLSLPDGAGLALPVDPQARHRPARRRRPARA